MSCGNYSIQVGWTKQALECEDLKQDCSRCSVGSIMSDYPCKMPNAIKKTREIKGEPRINLLKRLPVYEKHNHW